MRYFVALFCLHAAFAQSEIFEQFDTNKDQKISPSELPEQARPMLALIDSNQDGTLSKAEFDRVAASLASRFPATEPDDGSGLKNIDYVGNKNERQTLDLYYPEAKAETPLPLVVFIHGGGWMSGSKSEGKRFAKAITATGDYAVAAINYRLTQHGIWPAQIHDCKAAIRFLRGNADKYGIDANRIAVMGTSAGGHLAAMLGTSSGEASLEGKLGEHTDQSSEVDAVVNFFGPTDFITFFGKNVDIGEMGQSNMAVRLLGKTPEEIRENARLASPVTWVDSTDAPFLTAHGTKDRLVPFTQAKTLHGSLKEAKVESHLIAMTGAGHGFNNAELNKRIQTFLDLHLRDQPGVISTEPIRVQ